MKIHKQNVTTSSIICISKYHQNTSSNYILMSLGAVYVPAFSLYNFRIQWRRKKEFAVLGKN